MSTPANPLAALLKARAQGFGLDIAPYPPPPHSPPWHPAHTIVRDRELLEDLLEQTALAAGTDSRAVAATWHLEKHAWQVASTSLAAILVHGAMPKLDSALLRYAEQGWPEAIAVPSADWAHADGPALASRLEQHLAPIVDELARHRPRRALWRSVGDRLGQAAVWCGAAFDDHRRACNLATEALAASTALAGPAGFELTGDVPFRRRTGCCLSYRGEGGLTCEDCPLRARPLRDAAAGL